VPATGAMVELLLNSVWTDVTAYTYHRDLIRITRGRQDQGARVDPGSCTFTLNNKDGRFSPRNPLGAYFGQIGRNTPVRVSAVGGAPWLNEQAGALTRVRASTPDAAALHVTGDLDVRFDIRPVDWFDATSTTIMGRYGAAGNRSWRVLLNNGFLQLFWSSNGTATIGASMALVDGVGALTPRMRVRIVLDVDNGAAGSTARFYVGPSLDGPWTQFGADVVTVGTTSIFAGTAPLEVGDVAAAVAPPSSFRLYGARVLNGIAGTPVASPDFTLQTPTTTAFADAVGRTWTVTAGGLSNRHVRFLGEVSSWPSRQDISGGDVYTPVQAAGIMRRLGQGASPLDSTLRRRITTWPTVVAYWPMEDGQGAAQAYSPIAGVTPAFVPGAQLASDDSLAGSLSLPSWPTASAFTCRVPSYATSTSWQTHCVFKIDTAPAALTNLMVVQTTGTIRRWELSISVTSFRIRGYDADDVLTVDNFFLGGDVSGSWTRLRFSASTSGGTITWSMQLLPVGGVAGSGVGTLSGTSGQVTEVRNTVPSTLVNLRLGHVGVFSDSQATAYDSADTGFNGEGAGVRCARLASEENASFLKPYGTSKTAAMGPQRGAATVLDLLEEAQDADIGILYETRNSVALAYRPHWSLRNQTAALALSYTAKGLTTPLEPTEDDTNIRNDITVSRPRGSYARAVLPSGALSVKAPPDGIGKYTDSRTVNVKTDDQLADVAGWLLHLSTVDEPRFSSIAVNLTAAPELCGPAATVDIGDLITIDNSPGWLPPGTIMLMCQGYTEVLGWAEWYITYNCTSGSVWTIAVCDNSALGRVGTAGSSLGSAVTATDTVWAVASSVTPWTTNQAMYPFNWRVGGEVVTAAVLGTFANSNPFMAGSASGWLLSNSTIAWTQAVVSPKASPGQGSILVTPDGVSASGGVQSSTTAIGTVIPGSSYVAMGWVYSPGGWSDMRAAIDWFDASGTFLSSGIGVISTVPAGAWTFLQQTVVAPASASRARVRMRHGATPPSSAIWYAWGIRMVPVASVSAVSPQTVTVIRSINGIVKTQTSGTAIALAAPSIVAI
jgi:hypothetical protein